MKKLIRQKDIPSFILFGVTLILLSFLLIREQGFEIYLRILTPIIALGTGIAIFLNLRENQKSNKYIFSKELYEDFIEELEEHLKDTAIKFDRNFITQEDGHGGRTVLPHYQWMIMTTTTDWYSPLKKLMRDLKQDKGFERIIQEYEEEKVTNQNFDQFPYSRLPEEVDVLMNKVRQYYYVIQSHLYNLLNNNYDDFATQHRNFLIRKIDRETEYHTLIMYITQYFKKTEKGEIELTSNANRDNITVLKREVYKFEDGVVGYIIEKRDLVKWDLFMDIYKMNLKVEELRAKEIIRLQSL